MFLIQGNKKDSCLVDNTNFWISVQIGKLENDGTE